MCVHAFYIYISHLSVDEHLGSCHILAIVNKFTMNMGGQMSLQNHQFHFLLDTYSEVGLLDRTVVLFLIF